MVDECTRECPIIVVDTSLRAARVIETLHFIRPGTPTENAYIESFHGRFRGECLSAHLFDSLTDTRVPIERGARTTATSGPVRA